MLVEEEHCTLHNCYIALQHCTGLHCFGVAFICDPSREQGNVKIPSFDTIIRYHHSIPSFDTIIRYHHSIPSFKKPNTWKTMIWKNHLLGLPIMISFSPGFAFEIPSTLPPHYLQEDRHSRNPDQISYYILSGFWKDWFGGLNIQQINIKNCTFGKKEFRNEYRTSYVPPHTHTRGF